MPAFDILIVAQKGRLEYEAALFAASLRAIAPDFTGTLYVAEPQPGPLWPDDPRITDETRALLDRLDATHLPFETCHFGASYPQANKVEAMAALPSDTPVFFFDSDTIILDEIADLDLPTTPTASMQRENTWPTEELYGPDAAEVWKALYDRFDLDFAASLDPSIKSTNWRRFLYFNAGLIWTPEPRVFAATMLDMMTAIRDDPPPLQPIYPWLDQIALPLAITKHGGTRPSGDATRLDGTLSLHYRQMPLVFATASDEVIDTLAEIAAPNFIKKVLKRHEPFRRFLYQGAGPRARALFDRSALPRAEKPIRQKLKKNGLWIT